MFHTFEWFLKIISINFLTDYTGGQYSTKYWPTATHQSYSDHPGCFEVFTGRSCWVGLDRKAAYKDVCRKGWVGILLTWGLTANSAHFLSGITTEKSKSRQKHHRHHDPPSQSQNHTPVFRSEVWVWLLWLNNKDLCIPDLSHQGLQTEISMCWSKMSHFSSLHRTLQSTFRCWTTICGQYFLG